MWGGGITHLRSEGVPHLRSGGYPISGQGGTLARSRGVPQPGLDVGGTPSQVGGTPARSRWGTPQTWDGVPPVPGMGYPPDLGWGTPLDLGCGTPPDLGWGTPPDIRWGTPLDLRWGTPLDLRWGTPPRQISIASTCYAAGGMPLAFTQEDFIVPILFQKREGYIFSLNDDEFNLGCYKFLKSAC